MKFKINIVKRIKLFLRRHRFNHWQGSILFNVMLFSFLLLSLQILVTEEYLHWQKERDALTHYYKSYGKIKWVEPYIFQSIKKEQLQSGKLYFSDQSVIEWHCGKNNLFVVVTVHDETYRKEDVTVYLSLI